MARLKKMGVNTLGVLLEGRLEDAEDRSVEGPDSGKVDEARRALDDARSLGLATLLVPHLYVNDGTWRGRLEHLEHTDWWDSYGAFLETAAAVAESSGTTALVIGVELKAMSMGPGAKARFAALTERIRRVYRGQLVYAANWDEAEGAEVWDLVDMVGINGYYPLTPTPERGAERVARKLEALASRTGKQVLLVEVGYRSSPQPHVKPWAWPEQLEARVDQQAQASTWAAALTHWLGAPGVRGLLFWVVPTDPDDPDSEPPHGFNPLNKPAEEVLRRAFVADAEASR